MFRFFCQLAISIYSGIWCTGSASQFYNCFINYMKVVPIFGLFNNSTEAFYNTVNPVLLPFADSLSHEVPALAVTISVILSTICCISVFFIIVKAIKKLFTCFLDF